MQTACRLLSVAQSGYYVWQSRSPSAWEVRHAWLTEQIKAVHTASRGTYGVRRVHAELTLGLGLQVGRKQVELLMARADIKGLPGNRRPRPHHGTKTASDLVERMFTREAPNREAARENGTTPTVVTASRADFHRPALAVVVEFISTHQGHRVGAEGLKWGVESMCAVLSEYGVTIAPSTHYAYRARNGPSKTAWADTAVIDAIWQLSQSQALFKILGARKTWIVLRTNGIDFSPAVSWSGSWQRWDGAVPASGTRCAPLWRPSRYPGP